MGRVNIQYALLTPIRFWVSPRNNKQYHFNEDTGFDSFVMEYLKQYNLLMNPHKALECLGQMTDKVKVNSHAMRHE